MSIDFGEINMTVVKRVIDGISKPLTYICNLFQAGTFPNKMTQSEVKPCEFL